MKEGIYHVTFNSQSGVGDGIVVITGSAVNGGDTRQVPRAASAAAISATMV